MLDLGAFVEKYRGVGVNVDAAYGNQCWDLVAAYNMEVIGIPRAAGWGLPTGPNLDAWDVWRYFLAPLADYFDKIPNSPDPNNIPLPGDIPIWGGAGFPDGHIDICLSANPTSFVGFDQNWPIGSVSHTIVHNYNSVLGWLRPKKGAPAMPSAQEAKNYWKKWTGQDLNSAQVTYYSTKPWLVLVEDTLVTSNRQKDEQIANLSKPAVKLGPGNYSVGI